MSCAQILRANSRRRQWKNRHNTVRASRLTRVEAVFSLAVLKMYGKWFGRRTRALYWWGERLMFYRGTGGGDWLGCAAQGTVNKVSSTVRSIHNLATRIRGSLGLVTGGSQALACRGRRPVG